MLLRQRGNFLYFAQRHLLASGGPVHIPPSRDRAWLERGFVYCTQAEWLGAPLSLWGLALPPATCPAQDNSQERKHESAERNQQNQATAGFSLVPLCWATPCHMPAPAHYSGSRLLQALPAHHTPGLVPPPPWDVSQTAGGTSQPLHAAGSAVMPAVLAEQGFSTAPRDCGPAGHGTASQASPSSSAWVGASRFWSHTVLTCSV